jgi:hypothetical protein
MAVLERMGTVPQGTYDRHRGALLKLAQQMRAEVGRATP